MVSWVEVLKRLKEEIDDLSVRCGCMDEAYQSVAKLELSELSNPVELDRCSACMLREVLNELQGVVFIPIAGPLTSSELYVLDDVVVEISEDVGHVVEKRCVQKLIEKLRDLGYEIDDATVAMLTQS